MRCERRGRAYARAGGGGGAGGWGGGWGGGGGGGNLKGGVYEGARGEVAAGLKKFSQVLNSEPPPISLPDVSLATREPMTPILYQTPLRGAHHSVPVIVRALVRQPKPRSAP